MLAEAWHVSPLLLTFLTCPRCVPYADGQKESPVAVLHWCFSDGSVKGLEKSPTRNISKPYALCISLVIAICNSIENSFKPMY